MVEIWPKPYGTSGTEELASNGNYFFFFDATHPPTSRHAIETEHYRVAADEPIPRLAESKFYSAGASPPK